MDQETKFTYPIFVKYPYYLLAIMITGFFLFGFLSFSSQGVVLLMMDFNGSLKMAIYFLILAGLMPIIFITVINYWQEFTITQSGIEFQIFIFWRKFLPWSEIIAIKKSYLPWGKYHVIITRELTPMHRVVGLLYGLTKAPAFIFNNTLINYGEAVEQITKKINEL